MKVKSEGVRFYKRTDPHTYKVYDRQTDRLLGFVRKVKRFNEGMYWVCERASGDMRSKTFTTRRAAAEYLMGWVKDGASKGHGEDGMRYLIVRGGRPVRVMKNGLVFFASPRLPAKLFNSYEQCRSAIRRAHKMEKQQGWEPCSYRIQSVRP